MDQKLRPMEDQMEVRKYDQNIKQVTGQKSNVTNSISDICVMIKARVSFPQTTPDRSQLLDARFGSSL